MSRPGQVTTFYFYKGGVGRTFLLANVAWLLARWGRRVLVIDWDLEAPGVHHYLTPGVQPRRGLLDLLSAFRDGQDMAWRGAITPVSGPWEEGGQLDLIGAGAQDAAYLGALQRLDWSGLFDTGLSAELERRREEWVAEYDHVLLDSRTGLSDVGSICAAQLPDVLVLALTTAQQSIDGVLDVEARARATRITLPLDRGRFRCVPIPTRIHQGEELALEREWMARLAERLGPLMASWRDEDVEVLSYFSHLRVPEYARWSYGEPMPVKEERLDEPSNVSWAFANLAALLDGGLESSRELVEERNAFVSRAAGAAGMKAAEGARRFVYDVFVWIPKSEGVSGAVRRLVRGLEFAGLRTFVGTDDAGVDRWAAEIQGALTESRAVVVMVPPVGLDGFGALVSVRLLTQLVHDHSTPIIPVYLGEQALQNAPRELSRFIGLTVTDDASWYRVTETIAASLR